MKNRHRMVGLLLLSALIVSLWVPVVFADGGGTRASVETKLLTETGVYDETAAANAASDRGVTRAEAAYYAVLLAGMDKTKFVGLYEPIFSDLPQEHPYAGAITMAASLHIVSQASVFQPDENVTVNEMTKMLVSVLGYHAYAQLNGGYPTGYTKVANRTELFAGMTASGEDALNFADMTVMLNNTLHAVYMEQVTTGDTIQFQTQQGESLLSKVFHIYDGVGQITQNDITAVNSDESLGENMIEVGGHICKVTDDTLYAKLMQYLGYAGTYYIRESNGDKILISFLPDHCDVTTIFSENFESYEGGVIQYFTSNGSLKSLKLAADAAVIYNGKAVTAEFNQALFESDWGTIRIVKNDGVPDVVVISAYENYIVSAVDKENYVVYDNTISGKRLDFKKDGVLSKHAYFRSKTGETLDFNRITEGMVLSAAVSATHDYFDVIAMKETVSGILKQTRTETVGGVSRVKSVTIDANEYKVAGNIYDSDRIAQLMLGNKYTFALDAGGRIAAVITSTSGTEGGYVFLIDAMQSEGGLSRKLHFRILDADGQVLTLDAANTVTIDGNRYKSETEGDAILAQLSTEETEKGTICSQVAEIVVNDKSEIIEIDTSRITGAEDKEDSLQPICNPATAAVYRSSPKKMFESYFALTDSTKVFFYPGNTRNTKKKGTDEEYSVSEASYFRHGSKYTMQAFAREPNSPVAALITLEGSPGKAIDSKDYIMLVDGVSQALTEDGEIKTMLSGFYQGAAYQAYIEDDAVLLLDADTGEKPTAATARTIAVDKGDAIWFGLDAKGSLNEIELMYDYSEDRSYMDNNDMVRDAEVQTVYAPLYQMKDGFITLCKNLGENPGAETNPKRHFSADGYRVYVVEPIGKDGVTVRLGNTGELKDYYTYHDDYSMVLLQMRYYEPRTMIIYQK